ncbi:uroporphyrinogen-III synthase [Nakamurella panacisegetis]|uniref:Uroporphyrinogen-III synthase n=1 Tax=Nakamurella panacisegetis TaxID=1090615 RepID=A0A1H0SIP9_9ACTN|nr:uroporphyrinogen-III synthase [Nakamurella panacisegetis]SDP41399.1 uroporphyrinogen-III synthase [Nakamurella panacisegetis]
MDNDERTPDVGPLAGFTIGITAARRREEFGAALERRGATVMYGPAIQIVQVEDDEALRDTTLDCLAHPPDVVVATTGIGFRGWIEAADGWGLGDALLDCLGRAVLLARGPKARGAMRAAGLSGEWSPASESSTEVLERLLEMDLQGRRVAIQQHGEPLPDVAEALAAAGATVIEVQVYRWRPPTDPAPLERLCRAVVDRTVDAVTFTSAPAAASYLLCARGLGLEAELIEAMQRDVMAIAVGPVTAAPLDRSGVPVIQPERARLGALVRETADQLPRRLSKQLAAAGRQLQVRGQGVVVDGRYVALPPTGMALLHKLTEHPGQVVKRADLVSLLPGTSADEHAVEVAIARLRTALGNPKIIQTLVKRGYRIAYDPTFTDDNRY